MTAGDPAPDGSHGPHLLVVDVESPVLADDDRHHLERVLRVRKGDRLTIGDGAGAWRECRLGAEPEPTSDVRRVARPAVRLAVAFALTKGGRPEFVVQKLTELGVDTILPFVADRSVVHWDPDKRTRNGERLRRVAREAVMQSRRVWVPTVEEVADFSTAAARPQTALADVDGDQPSLATVSLMIGPEGGWSDEERASGLPRVSLGPGILRAETAAVAAGALLGALRTGLVAPVK